MICVLAGHNIQADEPQPALDVYTSTYFRATRTYARNHFPDAQIYVLSARHGLVTHDTTIQYDTRLRGSQLQLDRTTVRTMADARDLGLLISFQQVVALCGGLYLEVLALTFGIDRIVSPLAGLSVSKVLERLKTPLPYGATA